MPTETTKNAPPPVAKRETAREDADSSAPAPKRTRIDRHYEPDPGAMLRALRLVLDANN